MVYRKIKSTEVQFLTLKKVIILYLRRKFRVQWYFLLLYKDLEHSFPPSYMVRLLRRLKIKTHKAASFEPGSADLLSFLRESV